MLKEILNEFVGHEEEYPGFDTDAMVLERYRLKPGLYIRLNDDNSMAELYVTKKTDLTDNSFLVEWFKKADFASSLIESNKSVDKEKQIHSNNLFTLFCKNAVFSQDHKVHPKLNEHIERYFNALIQKDKKNAKILGESGYKPLATETVQACKERFLASLEEVAGRIKQLGINDKSYIKLFLNADEEAYVYESGRYLLPQIFNSNKYNLLVDSKILGLSNSNMGMNAKKPYLEHKSTAYKVPYRITTEEAILLRKLFLWLNGQERESKPIYTGYIPIWEQDPELLAVAGEVSTRKPVIYMHFSRGTDITIDDFDFLPSFNDRMDKPINFYNYLNADKYQGGKLDRLSAVEAHINANLYAFQLIYNYDTERIRVSERLSQSLADQIMLSRDAMRAWLRKGDSLPLRRSVDKVTRGVILARLQNMEYIPALAHALNVRFSLLKYFREEENDMGSTIEKAYLKLQEKVLNTKETANCESSIEFHVAVGQLLYFFSSLSQAQTVKYDVLWRGIAGAKDIEDIKKEYRKYFQRYAYAIETNSPRFNNMLSIASSYTPENNEPINLDALFYGFAAKNIIYLKKEEI